VDRLKGVGDWQAAGGWERLTRATEAAVVTATATVWQNERTDEGRDLGAKDSSC